MEIMLQLKRRWKRSGIHLAIPLLEDSGERERHKRSLPTRAAETGSLARLAQVVGMAELGGGPFVVAETCGRIAGLLNRWASALPAYALEVTHPRWILMERGTRSSD